MKQADDSVSIPINEREDTRESTSLEKTSLVLDEINTQPAPSEGPSVQNEQQTTLTEFDPGKSVDARRLENMLLGSFETADLVPLAQEKEQDRVERLAQEELKPIIENLDGTLQDVILTWFGSEKYFQAQVEVICVNQDLATNQKAHLIIDLLETLLDERRRNAQGTQEFQHYNDSTDVKSFSYGGTRGMGRVFCSEGARRRVTMGDGGSDTKEYILKELRPSELRPSE